MNAYESLIKGSADKGDYSAHDLNSVKRTMAQEQDSNYVGFLDLDAGKFYEPNEVSGEDVSKCTAKTQIHHSQI